MSACVVKLHEATQMLVMVDYVREMTAKKSGRYGRYISFEHLLFLFKFNQPYCAAWDVSCLSERPEWTGHIHDGK